MQLILITDLIKDEIALYFVGSSSSNYNLNQSIKHANYVNIHEQILATKYYCLAIVHMAYLNISLCTDIVSARMGIN